MKPFLISLTVVACAFLAGCGGSSSTGAPGFLRLVHASPNAPAVNIAAGPNNLSNITYTQASGYLSTPSGGPLVRITPVGSTTAVINANVPLGAGQSRTVIAGDVVANIRPFILNDDRTAPPTGQVRIRLVHASPAAGNVDIHVSAPAAALSSATLTAGNVSLSQNTGYLTVPAGSYRIRLTAPGTFNVAFDSGTVALTDGQVRTILAADANGGGLPVQAIILADRL